MSTVLAPPAAATQARDHARVSTLLEALPYMRVFHGQTMVVCTGGDALDAPASLVRVARDIALLKYVGIAPVVVHAGGAALGRGLARFGLEAAPPGDPAADEVAKMVLLGKVNKDVVAALHASGQGAVGLGGDDGALLEAGHAAGEVKVDVGVLRCLPERYIPVVATVASDPRGRPLPMQVEDVGHLIAVALGAAKLIFIADLAEVGADLRAHGRRRGPASAFRPLIAGMPSTIGGVVEACCVAVEQGVPAAHVVDAREPHSLLLELFTDEGTGLKLMQDPGSQPARRRSTDAAA
jgi:acetylglutamate kinase